MTSVLYSLFYDEKLVRKIKEKLPYIFGIAEIEYSKGGRIGMEVGVAREQIIISLLMLKFGEDNVNTEIPSNYQDVDVVVLDEPISIKTVSGREVHPFKLSWTVDPEAARRFRNLYKPISSIILVHVNWGNVGSLYYIPKEVQVEVYEKITEEYFKIPRQGTNPRGVEISRKALKSILNDQRSRKIEIFWQRKQVTAYNPYKRWIELWKEE